MQAATAGAIHPDRPPRDDLESRIPLPVPHLREHRDRGQPEHQVGQDRAGAGTKHLHDDVRGHVAAGDAAEPGVDQGHDRVDVGTGHRSEGGDQHAQDPAGRDGVLQ